MKKQVLFIHGAGEGAYKEDKNLAQNLQQLLGDSYEVRCPKMEDEENAPYEIWVNQIKHELASMTGDIFLVGHSVGASVLIKFLTEKKTDKPLAGVLLIAAPFWGGQGGWTYDGYKTLELPVNAATRLRENVPLFFYHSDNDETVPFAHLELFGKTFPGATVRKIKGRGHQFDNDLSEVATDIKKL